MKILLPHPYFSIRNSLYIVCQKLLNPTHLTAIVLTFASLTQLYSQSNPNQDICVVEFSQDTGSSTESTGENLPQIIVSGGISANSRTVEVALANTAGTATAGRDYNPDFIVPIIITIPAGDYTTAKSFAIPRLIILDDTALEQDETINFILQNFSPGIVAGSKQSTLYTITDDDATPAVTLTSSTQLMSEARGTSMITANLSNLSFMDVTVNLSFGGSASLTDYAFSSSSIVVFAGSTSASMIIYATSDNLNEIDEDVIVSINQITNGTEDGKQIQTIIIRDDKPKPSVTLSLDKYKILESNGVAILTAQTDRLSQKDIIISLSTSGDASSNGVDYILESSKIIIPTGQLLSSIKIVSVPDQIKECDEIISITATTSYGFIQSNPKTEIIIEDNSDPPTLSIRTENSHIDENGGEATLVMELSHPATFDVIFDLMVSGQVDEDDYSLEQDSFTIPAGELSVSSNFLASDDDLSEDTEVAIIQITNRINSLAHPTLYAIDIHIIDDDIIASNQGFSPDGDGINDLWYIRNIEQYPHNHVKVYNRWGNLVYDEQGYNNQDKGFSGQSNIGMMIGDAQLPDGTYYYLINLGDGHKEISGFVALYK